MQPDDFVKAYEAALATQTWSSVAPLVHEEACVTFSNGTVHKGKAAVQAAFERNFNAIQNEHYKLSNVHWLMKAAESAAFVFDFSWSGLIADRPASGAGRGTSVLVKTGDRWQLIAEHLGPAAD